MIVLTLVDKQVTEAVHAKGCFIFLQLWALGRVADPTVLASKDPPLPHVSSSPTALSDSVSTPRALSISEIHEYVGFYAKAASNAVHRAGFDGVEIHGANGYLIDQFLQEVCNKREDKYGGSIAGRALFAFEVVRAVIDEVGARRTGFRVSPWSYFQGYIHIFSHR